MHFQNGYNTGLENVHVQVNVAIKLRQLVILVEMFCCLYINMDLQSPTKAASLPSKKFIKKKPSDKYMKQGTNPDSLRGVSAMPEKSQSDHESLGGNESEWTPSLQAKKSKLAKKRREACQIMQQFIQFTSELTVWAD